jgi:quercetin dioxygenase-like cupin family protein
MEDGAMSEQETEKPVRKRMRPFFRHEAVGLTPEVMPILGLDESVQAGLAKLTDTGIDPNLGAKAQLLFSEGGDRGMSLSHVWLKSGFVHPRHSHDSDCLYYVLAGELRLGARTLGPGDGFFIPANAAYTYEAGPGGVEVLEFRNVTHFNLTFSGNDEAHWTRMAEAIKRNAAEWVSEPAPSTRG